MDKKTRNTLLILMIITLIIFPVLINCLMFVNLLPVKGEIDTWISTLGSFWGAIIGGVISGVITMIGVNKTIQASNKGIIITLKEEKKIREEELEIQTMRDRLFNLYHPVDSLVSEFNFKHGIHFYWDLSEDEQEQYIKLINDNIVYADSSLFSTFMHFKMVVREGINSEAKNSYYHEINEYISEEVKFLRGQLKLPNYVEYDE